MNPTPADRSPACPIRAAAAWLDRNPILSYFDSDLLEAFHHRARCSHAPPEEPARQKEWEKVVASLDEWIHESLDACGRVEPPGEDAALARSIAQLDRRGREIVLALALDEIGAMPQRVRDLESLQQALAPFGHDPVTLARTVRPDAPLVQAGLIEADEDVWTLRDMELRIGATLRGLLHGPTAQTKALAAPSQDALLEYVGAMVLALSDSGFRAETRTTRGPAAEALLRPLAARRVEAVRLTLREHPDWPLAPIADALAPQDFALLLYAAGRDLGVLEDPDDAFSGIGMAKALCGSAPAARHLLQRLRSDCPLRTGRLLAPCAGQPMELGTEDLPALAVASWEIADEARARLGLPARLERLRGVRVPRVRLEDLVLPESVLQPLRLAQAQVEHGARLFEEWGLGRILPYGRGVTLLFHGPPGTGKTATAEGLAHALGRPILAVQADQVLSCWVGETEKRLARAFDEAARSNAVLLFDEADSFFYDRADAQRTWEVSQANLLLTRLELYEGVCILATNRADVLDPALARRISLKVEFPRPDRAARAEIWRRLLRPPLPLAEDVDPEALAELDLTGAEIKLAVLNAARLAVSNQTSVCLQTLQRSATALQPRFSSLGFAN